MGNPHTESHLPHDTEKGAVACTRATAPFCSNSNHGSNSQIPSAVSVIGKRLFCVFDSSCRVFRGRERQFGWAFLL